MVFLFLLLRRPQMIQNPNSLKHFLSYYMDTKHQKIYHISKYKVVYYESNDNTITTFDKDAIISAGYDQF